MFDTDGEGGALFGTALMSSPAPVAYNNVRDCSNLVHVPVDSGASDHYFNDFLIPELNRRFLDYTCLTRPCCGGAARRHWRRNSSGGHHRQLWQRSSRSNPDLSCTHDWAQPFLGEDSNTEWYCLHFRPREPSAEGLWRHFAATWRARRLRVVCAWPERRCLWRQRAGVKRGVQRPDLAPAPGPPQQKVLVTHEGSRR